MTLATVCGVVLVGVSGTIVTVEVDVSDGLPSVGLVGLPDATVSEARSRARCAVDAMDATWPSRRITIGLSPAEVRKHGSGLDLPIAVGVLAASGQLPTTHLASTAFVGELGLDGTLRPARGALPAALAARRAGMTALVVPADGVGELARVSGITVVTARELREVVALLSEPTLVSSELPAVPASRAAGPDLADVRGHAHGRLALEVAAVGGHHAALIGAPGVGKTLLAQRLAGLLPDLDHEAALEVAAIHSAVGAPRPDDQYLRPPSRSPHHSASAAALLGSVRGSRVAPGAVTLAHHGVLFLDEAPEFARPALEGLRQPLESGAVTVDRTGWGGRLPASFQLVLAANPCPCGLRVGSGAACSCAPAAVRRYAARLSAPLLDRIDIRLTVSRPSDAELEPAEPGESSSAVRDRVAAARERSARRFVDCPWRINARIPVGELRRRWLPDSGGAELLRDLDRRSANLRGPDRVLRMAWSLADIGARPRPTRDDIAVALSLRGSGWAS
jgi:magnesium chelatase family protein